MRVVAGCDGGGTKCTVRVAVLEKGNIVRHGQASSGPANVKSDPALAMQSIREATRAALVAAQLPKSQSIDSFVAALAGSGNGRSTTRLGIPFAAGAQYSTCQDNS